MVYAYRGKLFRMKLKDKTIVDFLEKKVPQKACSACGKSDWSYDDKIFEIREFTGNTIAIGGKTNVAPFLTTSCNNCGNTRFYNLIVAGLMRPDGTLVDK